ncbi:GNAT family N-acetyltransferase [Micromonospora maris]|nr:GNAT family N-acetyltransferase [Micromonospora maris]WSK41114.1 GNAT family N-acetyltransferase [Micromonospora maris]
MRRHVGGAESEEQMLARHRRYLAMPATARGAMFVVLLGDEMVGSIGYHRRDWQGKQIYETGWNVLPPWQGRGVASAAGTALISMLREAARHRDAPDSLHAPDSHAPDSPDAPDRLHAFPSVENTASNAVCRRLGFTLVGPCDFEYPPGSGSLMRSNDWRITLTGP